MGFDLKLLEETNKFLVPLPGKAYFSRSTTIDPVVTPPEFPTLIPNTNEKKKRMIVIDGAGWLNFYTSLSGVRSRTIGDLVNAHVERVEFYLKDPTVEAVVFLYDQRTPVEKAASRKPTENTPHTPYSVLGENDGKADEDGLKAWTVWLMSNKKDDSDANALRTSTDGVDIYDCVLPLAKAELRNSGRPNDPAYEKFLENKHFKALLYKKVALGIADRTTVPEGKWLYVSARDICAKKTDAGAVPPEDNLRCDYLEGDRGTVYYATEFADRYDVDIDSIDGDVITATLLTAHLRVTPYSKEDENPVLEKTTFKNSLRILKGQFNRNSKAITLDVNNMWLALHQLSACMRKKYRVAPSNMVACWAMMAMLGGGNDYVDNARMPYIGPVALWKSFLTNIALFPNIISNHTGEEIAVVDPDAFAKFVLSAYSTTFSRFNTIVNYTNLEESVAQFNGLGEKRLAGKQLKVADIRQLAATITWELNYWISGAKKTANYLDGFERGVYGQIFGFSRENNAVDTYGHYTVAWSDDADAPALKALYNTRGGPVNSWDLGNTLEALKT